MMTYFKCLSGLCLIQVVSIAHGHAGHDERLKILVLSDQVHIELGLESEQLAAFSPTDNQPLTAANFNQARDSIDHWLDEYPTGKQRFTQLPKTILGYGAQQRIPTREVNIGGVVADPDLGRQLAQAEAGDTVARQPGHSRCVVAHADIGQSPLC